MTSDDKSRRVEVKDGDQPIAAAEVEEHAEGTVRASLLPSSEDAVTRPAGSTALVDADLPDGADAKTGQEPGAEAPSS